MRKIRDLLSHLSNSKNFPPPVSHGLMLPASRAGLFSVMVLMALIAENILIRDQPLGIDDIIGPGGLLLLLVR